MQNSSDFYYRILCDFSWVANLFIDRAMRRNVFRRRQISGRRVVAFYVSFVVVFVLLRMFF